MTPGATMTAAAAAWSGGELALRVGPPVALGLLGLLLYLLARAQRADAQAQHPGGGFGGPPGTTDVGSAAGFGVEAAQARRRAASRRALAGLVLMLLAALWLLGVIVWRLLS